MVKVLSSKWRIRNGIKRLAFKAALNSTHQHKVGAVIYKGNRVLATGFNKLNRNTCKCQTRIPGRVCAEMDAIIKCISPKHNMLEGASIFVCRLRRDGKIGLAKPCPTCQAVIKAVGIKKVSYTTEYGVEKL